MELQTVSTVSKTYGISKRMLSYYEQSGLIQSRRMDGYSYRVYDAAAVERLQQIILLRKLQIPIKQISIILSNPGAAAVVDIFKKNIHALDSEITALSTIKKILNRFVIALEEKTNIQLNLHYLTGDAILALTASLSPVQKNTKENISMGDLNQAAQVLAKLDNARVIYLPPMTIASYRHITECHGSHTSRDIQFGDNPKENAARIVDAFVTGHNLCQTKPDIRQLGFHHPTGEDYDGFEMCVSIPDGMEVPAPLVKKCLRGGLYVAALDVNWYDYKRVYAWITDSDAYQYDGDFTRIDPPLQDINSFAGLEFNLLEHLNYYHNVQNPGANDAQWEMLFPIKPYKAVEESPVEIPNSVEKCGAKAWHVQKNKIKLIGFTAILSGDYSHAQFVEEMKNDGRLDTLKQCKKPAAPIYHYHSADYEADLTGGQRLTFGILASDITDMDAFLRHNPYVQKIDASKWVVFEYAKGSVFHTDDNVHIAAQKLGYKFNCDIITGIITVYPDSNITEPTTERERTSIVYDWYPVRP
ncbi:MAG: effector binding domain-containing protein [Defluviitaleaceae bacterium]|nr:effector binding domain-containing protein [Defluviitaleaceae bacterium]